MDEALKNEWCRLFDLGVKIKKVKPWLFITENKLFILHLKKRNYPVVLHFMGNAEGNPAVFVYQTRNAQKNLSALLFDTPNVIDPLSYLPTLQDGLVLDFNDRFELSDEEYELTKELGYSFRGRKQWLSFTSFNQGTAPRVLKKSEIKLLADCLELVLANESVLKEVEKQEAPCHLFEDKESQFAPFDLYEENKAVPKPFKDKALIKRLAKLPQQTATLELSYIYTNQLLDDKVVIPLILCVETENGTPIFRDMIENAKLLDEKILRYVTKMVEAVGRPKKIVVRLEGLYSLLFDFCQKLDIELELSASISTFDEVCLDVMDMIEMPRNTIIQKN
ncbi:MAG: hypothetical protein RR554_09775 [Vagococcus sp.]|uniref:DUF7309 domain-containing protein n=1 Tax=Vagococcus sp. TaxID=1933889 RepID=UPI002FCC20F6